MFYSDLVKKAMKIAFDIHRDQVDKGGYPYIAHPLHLAEQMATEDGTIVALLHDVIEDGDISLDYLKSEGFSDEVIKAIDLLTRKKGQTYSEYILEISKYPLAKSVKIKDLMHNLDESRIPSEGFFSLRGRYEKALKFLQEK